MKKIMIDPGVGFLNLDVGLAITATLYFSDRGLSQSGQNAKKSLKSRIIGKILGRYFMLAFTPFCNGSREYSSFRQMRECGG